MRSKHCGANPDEASLVAECSSRSPGESLTLDEGSLAGFLERDLLATINTDGSSISGVDLRYEYEVAAPAAGLTAAHTRQAQRNALAIAFLSDEERAALEVQTFFKKP